MDGGDAMRISKKLLALIILISGIVGFFVVVPVHYALEKTSTDKFCDVCHEMDPMVIAYQDDVHSGKGKTGVKAKCVDCHLPHDSYISYVFQKGLNGFNEVTHMMFNDADKMDWQAHRQNRTKFVYDSGCISCHERILDVNSTNANINDMHKIYADFKDKKDKLSCVSCHKTVGHKNLGKILYEIKNPPVGNWDDESKKDEPKK